MMMAILLWIALIWYIAFYSRSKPLILLDLLTAAWVVFLIRNMGSPHGLLYADIAPMTLYAGVNSWWAAIKFTMLASLLFCFYAGFRMFLRGDKQAALALVSGLSILVAASLADHLLNTSVIHTLHLAPFGFIGFLLANSVYLIHLDYRNRRKAIRAPVIYSLTFNPGQTSFDSKLSDLQSLPDEEPEVAVAHLPESAATTDRETLPFSTFLPADKGNRRAPGGCPGVQGELPSGERRCPGVQGESPSGERGCPGVQGEAPAPGGSSRGASRNVPFLTFCPGAKSGGY